MIVYNIDPTIYANNRESSSAPEDSVMKDFDWCRYYFKSASGVTYSAESNVVSKDTMKAELEEIIGEPLTCYLETSYK